MSEKQWNNYLCDKNSTFGHSLNFLKKYVKQGPVILDGKIVAHVVAAPVCNNEYH